jgi:HAD superfamily hydrolase (TIGR01450 family)
MTFGGSIYPMRLYDGYVFDLDGTLYRGAEPIPGAVNTVVELKRRGAQIRYLTNNSSQTREFFAQKLSGMGFPVSLAEIGSSGLGTAALLSEWGERNAYVVGEPGLVATLREAGVGVQNADENGVVRPDLISADSVVVGIHHSFTYQMMNGAMQCLLAGARFVATNRDVTFPLEGGRLTPGAGSIVAGIAACSGLEPFVVGKPNPYLIELILKETGLPKSGLLVVGDRDDTDLESGRRAGCDTHLVLTGVETNARPGQSFSQDLRSLLD